MPKKRDWLKKGSRHPRSRSTAGKPEKQKDSRPAQPAPSGGGNNAGDYIAGDQVGGDKIEIGDVKDQGRVTIGETIVEIGTQVVTVLQANLTPVLILLGVIAAGVAAVLSLEIIPRVQAAQPRQMDGTFNIAVAAFDEISEGQSWKSEQGARVANWLVEQLNTQKSSYPPGFIVRIWGPELTGEINGATIDQRAASAEALSKRIHANILIYGTIQQDQDSFLITPQFYVADGSFLFAQELTGPHSLGIPIQMSANTFQSPVLSAEINDRLNARAQVLAYFSVGLMYYTIDQYEMALNNFQLANQVQGWPVEQGKEVVYLFLGNASLNLKEYPQAIEWFQKALEVNPHYSRAYLGMGFTLFQQALLPMRSDQKGRPDLDLLKQSITEFETGAKATDQPANADIPWKVHLGIGRVYLTMGQEVHPDYYNQALAEFNQVTAAYEAGKVHYVELAAQSYSLVGIILVVKGRPDEAITALKRAIDLGTENDFRALWAGKVSQLYQAKGDAEQARRFAEMSKSFHQQAGMHIGQPTLESP